MPIERTVYGMDKFGSRCVVTCPICGNQLFARPHTTGFRQPRFFIYIWHSKETLRYSINYVWFEYQPGELPNETVYYLDTTGLGNFNREEQKILCQGWNTGYSDIGYVPKDIHDYRQVFFPGMERAINNSVIKNCSVKNAPKDIKDLSQWFKILARHPQCEYLQKAGLEDIIEYKIYGIPNYIRPNWKADSLSKFLGISPDEIAKLKQWDGWDKPEKIGIYKMISKTNKKVTRKMFNLACAMFYHGIIREVVNKTSNDINFYKLCKYLNKTFDDNKPECYKGAMGYTYSRLFGIYVDYYKQSKVLKYDDSEYNLFPPDLFKAHDRVSAEYTKFKDAEMAKKMRKNDAKLKRRVRETLQKLAWSDGHYCINPLACYNDFSYEGRNNHNCVASYYERCVDGKTSIFVIREVEHPETSYVTLELSNDKKVKQCYKTGNTSVPEDVDLFVKRWMDEIVNRKKKKQEAA